MNDAEFAALASRITRHSQRLAFIGGIFCLALGLVPATAHAQSFSDLLKPAKQSGPDMSEKEEKEFLRKRNADPKKRAAAIKSCISLMTKDMPARCRRNTPVLDTSGCKNMLGSPSEIRAICTRITDGGEVQYGTRRDGTFGPLLN